MQLDAAPLLLYSTARALIPQLTACEDSRLVTFRSKGRSRQLLQHFLKRPWSIPLVLDTPLKRRRKHTVKELPCHRRRGLKSRQLVVFNNSCVLKGW